MLSGYKIVDKIHTGKNTDIYRAIDLKYNRQVVIKIPNHPYPTFELLMQLRHQYTIAQHFQHPQILETYCLEPYQNGYALVMADYGGISLQQWLKQTPDASISTKLQIAIDLTLALHELSKHRIIHKDLNPANILIHPQTLQIKPIDFGIASQLPKETIELGNPNILEGTLAYIAPEQTGRMNRGIDYRCDLYSLGITLFELFTGKLPFEAQSSIDWIDCHLSQIPEPANFVNPQVPELVSQIIAKLVEKTAEERYQTALGLNRDLERCLMQWQATNCIDKFRLGEGDLADRFVIPERLYGRELAVNKLLSAFKRVASGSNELVSIAGISGIGKTALVNEVHKPITRQRGYFIKGKFDQFNRDLPLSAFVRAFRDLISQISTASEIQIATWQERILLAIGDNGRVLIAVIPELERIIGKQPPVPELTGTAAQNRFNWVFQKFVRVFASAEHPLTIFLDDLQWADSASLQLIKLLMAGNGYLLLLGAYRDNEVSPAHPLMLTISELNTERKLVETITLAPLTFDDTNCLVADTLHCSPDRAQPLTELIDLKTQGNPFFITQFLKSLYEDGAIWFAPSATSSIHGGWECELVSIQALSLNDNVVAFMATQLQKLSLPTQELLQLAACIGNRFDLQTLAIVCERSPVDTATTLWNALQAGLILPDSQIYKFFQTQPQTQPEGEYRCEYRFLHDRVQQAAYLSIPEDRQQQTHLQIGRLLLANTPAERQSERLFEIVNHFNTAISLITSPAEIEMLAQFNLDAAKQARSATAYAAAFNYAQIGVNLVGESGWENNYQLTLALAEILAEAAFLNGDFEIVPELVNVVVDRAKNTLDRLQSYEVIIHFYTVQKQYREAIDCGLEILQQLGVKISHNPHKLVLIKELVTTKLAMRGKDRDRLLAAPEVTDPHKIAPLRILDLLLMPTYFSDQELMLMVTTAGVWLTLKNGNTPWAASFYGTYGFILSSLGEGVKSYQMGKLAVDLVDRFNNLAVAAKVKSTVPWLCQCWVEDLRNSFEPIDRGMTAAIDSGNLSFLGMSAYLVVLTRFYAGIYLDEISDKIPEIEQQIVRSKDESSQQLFTSYCHLILNLRVTTSQPELVMTTPAEEAALIDRWQQHDEASSLSTIYSWKTYLAYTFEDLPAALHYADCQLPYESTEVACYKITPTWMVDALVRLAVYPHQDDARQQQILNRVNFIQKNLLQRAKLMPGNFQHKYDLVAAEKCRAIGDFISAMELYDRAISGAQTHQYLQEEALANELAAKFYQGWGKPKIAATYMQSAYYCYAKWGAKAKTDDLESRYPQLLEPILQARAQSVAFNPLITLSRITNSGADRAIPSADAQNFDLGSAIQTARELSGIIELPALLQQLCRILRENSGAQICIPILRDRHRIGSNQSWQVYEVASQNQIPLADYRHLPQQLIQSAIADLARTAIFDRQTISTLGSADRYLSRYQPQQIACLPLIDRGELQGIIYLEYRDTTRLLTPDLQIILEFLASQAAITLANARLYTSVAQHSAAIAASLDGFAILDNDRFIYLNQAHAQMFGYTTAELMGQSWHCLYTPEQIQSFATTAFPAVGQFGQWRGEAVATRKDGTTFDEEITLFLVDKKQLICICRDITIQKNALRDRQAMEIALRESESRYHQLVSNIPAALYQFEMTAGGVGKMNYLSARFSELFEIAADDVLANISALFDRVFPDDRQSFDRSFKRATRLGKSWSWEGRVVMPSGKIKWICGESRPISTPAGTIVWDGILTDVTDRKHAEIALRESEARYQKLADNIPGVIYQFRLAPDGSSRYLYMSSGCVELFGIPAVAALADANSIGDLIHVDDRLNLQQALTTSAQNLTPKLWEGRVVLAAGEIKWIRSASRPELQPDGAIVWDGAILDITAQKAAERELRKSQQQMKAFIDNSPAAMYLKDIEGRYLLINQTCVNLSGGDPSRFLGETDYAVYPPEIAQQVCQNDRELIRVGKNISVEENAISPDAVERTYLSNKFVLTDDNGKPYALGGVSTEITALKQAEARLNHTNQQLELANQELIRATRLKDEFLATMSHELRTPLNAILGMSEALQDNVFGDINQSQLNAVTTIEKSGKHLLSLINDILDVSKMVAGQLELNIAPVAVTELCKSSLLLVKQQAIAKQIHIETHLAVPPDPILVDERRMLQVLINLLNNAIKFTPTGGRVNLTVSLLDCPIQCPPATDCLNFTAPVGDRCLCLAIADTGIGISPADRSKLFQPFSQIDSRLNRQYQGTGLGLTIVKQITELHGGYITLESEVGTGSCFSVIIPQSYAVEPMESEIAPSRELVSDILLPPPVSRTILLAEDNEVNIDTFSSYLTAKGYRIISAQTGREAIELAQDANPDVILMDLQMPDLDGIAAIEQIRQQSQHELTPIIVLTALTASSARDRCRELGVDLYLTKPVKLLDLYQAIENCLHKLVPEPQPDK